MSDARRPWELCLVEAAGLIAAGELAPSELVASALERLDAVEPLLHAFVSVDHEGALREARAQDGRSGGALRGIPIAIKDIFDMAGQPTGNGSRAYANARSGRRDAAAVARLRTAGAVSSARPRRMCSRAASTRRRCETRGTSTAVPAARAVARARPSPPAR